MSDDAGAEHLGFKISGLERLQGNTIYQGSPIEVGGTNPLPP